MAIIINKFHAKLIKSGTKRIKQLKAQIEIEKNKISNSDYVKSKLNKNVKNIKEYIDVIKKL